MGLIFDLECPVSMRVTPQRVRERKPRRRIESDTPIIPRAVAEAVCEEVCVWLDEELPRRWVWILTVRANEIYTHNRQFYRKIRGQGTVGRDYLWVFMRHWLAALLHNRRPELFDRLPASYSVGRDLPERPTNTQIDHPPLTDSKRTRRRIQNRGGE